jgi:hypothetical protein
VIKVAGLDGAIVGVGRKNNLDSLVYDYNKCVSILMERMTREEAIEYMEKVLNVWQGIDTPIFIMRYSDG